MERWRAVESALWRQFGSTTKLTWGRAPTQRIEDRDIDTLSVEALTVEALTVEAFTVEAFTVEALTVEAEGEAVMIRIQDGELVIEAALVLF